MKKIILIVLLCLCFAVPALAEYPAFDLENGIVTLNNGDAAIDASPERLGLDEQLKQFAAWRPEFEKA